jgi:hypothetical protein
MPNPTPSDDEFEGVFGGNATPAEILLLMDKLCGRELARFAATEIDPERGSLRRIAKELKRGGATDLAAMVGEIAKTAPVSPRKTFGDMVRRRQRRKP